MGRILAGILLVFVLVPAQKGLAMSFDMKAAKKMYRHAMMDVFAKNTMKTPRFSAHRGSQAMAQRIQLSLLRLRAEMVSGQLKRTSE